MEKRKVDPLKALLVILFLLCLPILYPLWRLFVLLINLVGVNGIRNTSKQLETPVVFYEHPTTKREVVFIATIHIAEPEYFNALQQLIDSLPNHKILFERVGKLSSEEQQALTEEEAIVAKDFASFFALSDELTRVISLMHQRDGLAYDVSWVNTDLKLYDLVRSFTRQRVRLTRDEIEPKDLLDKEELIRWITDKTLNRFAAFAAIMSVATLFSRDKRLGKQLILDQRNTVAIHGIHKYLLEGNIATIWGAAHLAGIEKQLKQLGFREVRRTWFVAYHTRDYKIFDLKKIIKDAEIAASAATSLKDD